MQESVARAQERSRVVPEVPPGHTRVYPNKESDPTEYLDVENELLKKMRDLLAQNPDTNDHVHDFLADAEAVSGANCHKTAFYLTNKMTREELFAPTNHDIKTAGHIEVASRAHTNMLPPLDDDHVERYIQQLFAQFARMQLPFRITFFAPHEQGLFPKHSITVFGVTNKNNWHGFEKEDAYADNHFQDVNVENVITWYLTTGHRIGIEKQP